MIFVVGLWSISSYTFNFAHLLNFMVTKMSWRVKPLNLRELKILGFTVVEYKIIISLCSSVMLSEGDKQSRL